MANILWQRGSQTLINSNLGRVLVTGAASGIGRYIHQQVGGVGLTRQSGFRLSEFKQKGFDTIIHCAFNSTPTRAITTENINQYYRDNVLLTEELLQIPHERFAFFSTVDVYPRSDENHTEDEIIAADSVRSIHGTTKLISESIIRVKGKNFLILRPTSLLGPYMRKNNLTKIIEDDQPVLSLASNSIYNHILYSDVLNFICSAVDHGATGIFNLASAKNMTLARVAEVAGKKVVFGTHYHDVGNIGNQKATRVLPQLSQSSEQILRQFLTEKNLPFY